MIDLQPTLFKPNEVLEMRSWLLMPGRRLFVQFLLAKSAEFSAAAINDYLANVNPDRPNQMTATAVENAERSKSYAEAAKAIELASVPDFDFSMMSVRALPTTQQNQ